MFGKITPETKPSSFKLMDVRTLNIPNDLIVFELRNKYLLRIVISEYSFENTKAYAKFDIVDLEETTILFKSDELYVMGNNLAETLRNHGYIEHQDVVPLVLLLRRFIYADYQGFLTIASKYNIEINSPHKKGK